MLTRVEKKVIGKCVKSILPLVAESERVHTVSTEDYLARFCSHLDLDMSIRNAAAKVVQKASDLGILAGKSPLSVCAAAIYLVTQLTHNPKSGKEISPVAGVSDVTIRNAYKDLHARRHEVVPKDFKMVIKSFDLYCCCCCNFLCTIQLCRSSPWMTFQSQARRKQSNSMPSTNPGQARIKIIHCKKKHKIK